MPEETKGLLQSKTIIGVILAVGAPFINRFFGVEIDAALEIEIVSSVSDTVTAVGTLLAVYGRIVATKTVSIAPIKLK